ncbi:MAG: ABC transporter substrate-binding protein [Microbacteriaceae bacterium]
MSLFSSSRAAVRAFGALAVAAVTLSLAACAPAAETGSESATRTYESDFGAVEIPTEIERVVSVDFYTPAALMDIGVTPVGVVNSYFTDLEGDGIPLQYSEPIRESGATSIGEYYELNLEAIVQAKPDVVLATQDFLPLDDPMRAEIEKIAPIITFDARDGEAWRTRATELAKIFGQEEKLQPLVDEYNERRDALKKQYADLLANNAFTVFVPYPDEWATYAETHFSTPILRDLGAKFREQQDDEINPTGFPEWFSYEELGRLSNADIVLMPETDAEAVEKVKESTLWQNLPAVKNGMVFGYIDLSPTGSFGWALENLDELDEIFAEIEAKADANS